VPAAVTHGRLGAFAGAGATLLIPDDLPVEARLTIALSAAAAGYAGGRLPDILEPAVHAWHRELFHGGAFGAGVAWLALDWGACAVRRLLDEAKQIRARRLAAPPGQQDLAGFWFQEHRRYATVGFLIGLPVGYLSHLLADASTPCGLPLVGLRLGAGVSRGRPR
jgi:hypothetical protein